ncbi:MAG: hypothetical protein Kow0077_26450 [Anaerolineae bacterium]
MRPPNLLTLLEIMRRNPLLPHMPHMPDWAHLPGLARLRQRQEQPDTSATDRDETEAPPRAHRFEEFPPLEYPIVPASGDSGRILVLLRGINTEAASLEDQINHWRFLVEGVEDLYSGVVYFSYSATDPVCYTPIDTHKSVWHHHRKLLYNLLAFCADQGYRSFDLIGHSLGGVVATEYLIYFGLRGPQAGWVRHVITLDSPVNGSSRAAFNDFTYRETFASLGIQAMLEIADLYLNREHYARVKQRILAELHEQGVSYWNLTSLDDWVVPVQDAILANNYRVYRLGRSLRSLEPSLNRGHAQVFYSKEVRDDIRLILESDAPLPAGTVPQTARFPLPEPASHLVEAATGRLRQIRDASLLRMAMMMTTMHYYTQENPEASPLDLVQETVAETVQRSVEQARALTERAAARTLPGVEGLPLALPILMERLPKLVVRQPTEETASASEAETEA